MKNPLLYAITVARKADELRMLDDTLDDLLDKFRAKNPEFDIMHSISETPDGEEVCYYYTRNKDELVSEKFLFISTCLEHLYRFIYNEKAEEKVHKSLL